MFDTEKSTEHSAVISLQELSGEKGKIPPQAQQTANKLLKD
jgi:hypothetical protein